MMRWVVSNIIAVLCSDIHLSQTPPSARSSEPNWFDAMRRVLDEIRDVAGNHPIVCAGDVFDTWRSPPELINFAIANLPKMYSITGQHDLPYHNYDDIRKSAYWTLVEAKVLFNLEPTDKDVTLLGWPISIWSFPWGFEITPPVSEFPNCIKLAVIHDYCWTRGKTYPGAPEEKAASVWYKKLKGFDCAVFGDNHKGFLSDGKPQILNNGCVIRRKSDEIEYRPSIGLLYDDGTIRQHFLDTSKDSFTDEAYASLEKKPEMKNYDLEEFIQDLKQLSSDPLDFKEAVRRYVSENDVTKGTKNILLSSING